MTSSVSLSTVMTSWDCEDTSPSVIFGGARVSSCYCLRIVGPLLLACDVIQTFGRDDVTRALRPGGDVTGSIAMRCAWSRLMLPFPCRRPTVLPICMCDLILTLASSDVIRSAQHGGDVTKAVCSVAPVFHVFCVAVRSVQDEGTSC